MKVTMLNGLPITMLNGPLGCDCQNRSQVTGLGETPGVAGLLVAGSIIGLLALAGEKKKAGMNGFAQDVAKDTIGKVAVVGAGVAAVYFLVARPLLRKVGILDSKEDKQAEVFATSSTSPFNPQYYKGRPVNLTKAFAQQLATQIHDADGYFNDDEDAVYAALRQLKTKNDVSWLADNFQMMYAKDMYTYIRAFLDDSEMSIVHGIVNGLR